MHVMEAVNAMEAMEASMEKSGGGGAASSPFSQVAFVASRMSHSSRFLEILGKHCKVTVKVTTVISKFR